MPVRTLKRFLWLVALGSWTVASPQALDRLKPSVTLQTGFGSTFQLTLGGTFGDGPAWQNRAVIEFANVATKGDAIILNGWMTIDTPTHRRDWMAIVGYRTAAKKFGPGTLGVTTSWQRWLFPSVLGGTRDHVLGTTGVYRTRWRLPITVNADNWVLLKSPLRKGNLTYVQANVTHQLWEGKDFSLVARHGPATTYSLRFYDRSGWRVFRYGGSLALEGRSFTLEGSWRQQAAIASRVPDNRYWTILLSRRF